MALFCQKCGGMVTTNLKTQKPYQEGDTHAKEGCGGLIKEGKPKKTEPSAPVKNQPSGSAISGSVLSGKVLGSPRSGISSLGSQPADANARPSARATTTTPPITPRVEETPTSAASTGDKVFRDRVEKLKGQVQALGRSNWTKNDPAPKIAEAETLAKDSKLAEAAKALDDAEIFLKEQQEAKPVMERLQALRTQLEAQGGAWRERGSFTKLTATAMLAKDKKWQDATKAADAIDDLLKQEIADRAEAALLQSQINALLNPIDGEKFPDKGKISSACEQALQGPVPNLVSLKKSLEEAKTLEITARPDTTKRQVNALNITTGHKAFLVALVDTNLDVAVSLTAAIQAFDLELLSKADAQSKLAQARLALQENEARKESSIKENERWSAERDKWEETKDGDGMTAYNEANAKVGESATDHRNAVTAIAEAKRQIASSGADVAKALALERNKSVLIGMVRFGPLSQAALDPSTVHGLDMADRTRRSESAAARREAATAIMKSAKDYPEIVIDALDVLGRAEHPEEFTKGIAAVGELFKSNFGGKAANAKEAKKMAQNALAMAGQVGAGYLERMKSYYAQPANIPATDACRVTGTDAVRKTSLKYTSAIGGALLDADGGLAPDSASAKSLRNNLLFHPDSLKDPLPLLAQHVEAFCATLNDPAKVAAYQSTLSTITQPKPGVASLVRSTLGLPPSASVDAKGGKQAVLGVMLTPLVQGQVGSCFATCNCMDAQAAQPEVMMDDLAKIVSSGTLSKAGTGPIPAVTNTPAGENALLRSWEYSIATLGARSANSGAKKGVKTDVHNALVAVQNSASDTLKSMDKGYTSAKTLVAQKRLAYDQKLALAQSAASAFNAVRHLPVSDPARATALTNNNNAVDAHDTALAELDTARDALNLKEQQFSQKWDLLKQAAADAINFTYDPTLVRGTRAADGSSTNGGWVAKTPAQPPNTGEIAVTTQAEYQACLKKAFKSALGADADPAKIDTVVNSAAFMDSLLDAYDGKGTPWRQETGGLESDSKKALFPGNYEKNDFFDHTSASTVEAKTEALVAKLVDTFKDSTDPTVTLGVPNHAERALPKHPSLDVLKSGGDVTTQVRTVFAQAESTASTPIDNDKAAYLYDKALNSFVGEFFNGDLEGLTGPGKEPKDKNPGEFRQAILDNAAPKIQAMVDRNLSVNPSFTDDTLREHYEKQLASKIDQLIIKELYTEFVIADPNWGDMKSKNYHVVAPDPMTGKAKLWLKDEASGTLTPAGDEWVSGNWSATTRQAT